MAIPIASSSKMIVQLIVYGNFGICDLLCFSCYNPMPLLHLIECTAHLSLLPNLYFKAMPYSYLYYIIINNKKYNMNEVGIAPYLTHFRKDQNNEAFIINLIREWQGQAER